MSFNSSKISIKYDYNFPQVARESGFKLRQYKDGPMDWRVVGSVEVERILREENLEQIDNILAHLCETPLGTMLETNILDPGIAKYFILSQFAIQYLYFCREFLEETVRDFRDSHGEAQLEIATLKQQLNEANNEILQLHKKITQIEAIHEVVFPCQWCTKSFISNEALNIHISRRHNVKSPTEKRSSTPLSGTQGKDREYDLSLINTIKLELEIKKLKERLNAAEKEIRDRGMQQPVVQELSPHPRQAVTPNMISIGIQSNLMEHKEKDDTYDCDESESVGQIISDQVETKGNLNFREWRNQLEIQHEASIDEINKKLTEITEALNHVKSNNELQSRLSPAMERRVSQSVENLESMLTEKIFAISVTSAKKIEEVIHHMELDYKQKLNQLELQIKNDISTSNLMINNIKQYAGAPDSDKGIKSRIPTRQQHGAAERKLAKEQTFIINQDDSDQNRREHTPTDAQQHEQEKQLPSSKQIKEIEANEPLSDQTFIKESDRPEKIEKPKETSRGPEATENGNTSSDVCSTLDSSEEQEPEENRTPEKPPRAIQVITTMAKKRNQQADEEVVHKIAAKKSSQRPKQFSRKDSKKIADERLFPFKCSMKTTAITLSSYKQINEELAKRRHKIKQRHPQFYATRNKFRKLVDQLCSAKLPKDVKMMLKAKRPLQPLTSSVLKTQHDSSSSQNESIEDNREEQTREIAKEAGTSSNDVFKDRLERILASPIRKPMTHDGSTKITTKAQLHAQTTYLSSPLLRPIPLPRKRVMFDTTSAASANDDSADSAAGLSAFKVTNNAQKNILASSTDSLL